jgi:hypothetical protein
VHSQSCTSLAATRKPNHSLMPAKFHPQVVATEAEPIHAKHQRMWNAQLGQHGRLGFTSCTPEIATDSHQARIRSRASPNPQFSRESANPREKKHCGAVLTVLVLVLGAAVAVALCESCALHILACAVSASSFSLDLPMMLTGFEAAGAVQELGGSHGGRRSAPPAQLVVHAQRRDGVAGWAHRPAGTGRQCVRAIQDCRSMCVCFGGGGGAALDCHQWVQLCVWVLSGEEKPGRGSRVSERNDHHK